MRYWAKINNGIVETVIVCDDMDFLNKQDGVWIETKYDGTRKQFASKNMSYDEIKDKFISAKKYTSWVLDVNDNWQAPIPEPEGKIHRWNENNKNWEL